MSVLWVRVHSAQVDEPEPTTLQVMVRAGNTTHLTRKVLSPHPHWDQDFKFEVQDLGADLRVELRRCKLLFGYELMGIATIPLYTVRHSNKHNNGQWSCLLLPSPSEASHMLPTKHLLQLDTRFELPRDLPHDMLEVLERKLETYESVLEKEVEIIEDQNYKIAVGELSPPPTGTGEFSYPPSISSSPSFTSETQSVAPSVTLTSPIFHTTRTLRDDNYEDSSYSTPSLSIPSHSSPSYSMPSHSSPSHFVPSHSTPSPSTSPHSTPSHSPQHHRHTLTPDSSFPSGNRGFIKTYDTHGRISPSPQEELQIVMQKSQTQGARWKQLIRTRNFQQQMEESRRERGRGSESDGHRNALAELVEQMTGFREKRLELCNVESFSAVNRDFRTRSRSFIDVKRKRLKERRNLDEELRIHIYKKTLAALIYPVSEPDAHKFERWTARKPTNCSECLSLLWGITKQGVKCKHCGKICHERCASLASQECFHNHYLTAITDKMHRTIINHASMFRFLREAFFVSEQENEVMIEEAQQRILDMTQNFSASVKVKVVAAQGLNLKSNGKDRRIYVSVDVGNSKKRTRAFKEEGSPQWNEQFVFTCYNYHELIRIRVWNERDSPLAKVAQKLTSESDTFLGEKIIEIRRVGPPRDVWYKLDKRTQGSVVSGSISVNVSAKVEGDSTLVPYHEQYQKLHEQLFMHFHLTLNFPLMTISPETKEDEEKLKLLPKVAQEITDEFAIRYSVEPIYRLMVHLYLLVHHHSIYCALEVMDNLLKNLKDQILMHVGADNSVRQVGAARLLDEYFDAVNFGRDNFARLLDKLLASLRLDLQQYREFYPSNDGEKLEEFEQTVQLVGTVLDFQQQAMGLLTLGKLEDMVQDSMKACLKTTFDFIVQNMIPEGTTGHPALLTDQKPFAFFYDLMDQIRSVVYEDRKAYAPIIAKLCSFDFGDISAMEMWGLFSTTIQHLFEDEASLHVFAPRELINLYIAVKDFYTDVVGNVPSRKDVVPEYAFWFVPCVRRWLQEYQKNAEFFVGNAWEDDKRTLNFSQYEEQPYSNSVYQMFFYLHKGYDAIANIKTKSLEVKQMHLHESAFIIRGVVQFYVDKVAMYLPECVSDLPKACMLLNNLQALRVHIQTLYEEMGGRENAGPGCTEVLHNFQVDVLAKELSSWCIFVARSLIPSLNQAVGDLQSEVMKLKGQGRVEKEEVRRVVAPLLDMLTKKALVTIAANCSDLVLQKVVKEVWRAVLRALHQMLLPGLKVDQARESDKFPLHHYTSKQCTSLEKSLEVLKEVFLGSDQAGLKSSTMDHGIKLLRKAISFYRHSTDQLITNYLADALASGYRKVDVVCGEVSLEVDHYIHPATRELEGTIRVISATNLKPFQGGTMRSFIELTWILSQPPSSESKRKFTTRASKTASLSQNYNESFQFILNTREENCELQVTVKCRSSAFGLGADKIVGVGVVPLVAIQEEPKLTVELGPAIFISEQGQALLNVLSVRKGDNWAQEFVAVKTQHRWQD